MHRLKVYLTLAAFSLLLSACAFRLPGLASPQATKISNADQIKQIVDATMAAMTETAPPTATSTQELNLPLLANSTAQTEQPGKSWQLVTRESDDIDEILNLATHIRAPMIEGEQVGFAENFNHEVQRMVDIELEVKDSLGNMPLEDPGGFIQMGYQVTSARDWQAFQPNALAEENPSARAPDQIVLHGGHDILSVVFFVSEYLGGAHPGGHHDVINYDLSEAKVLSLGDLFKPESNYLEAIADYSIQELKKNQEVLFPNFEEGASPN
ncbi:MAG TPA: hypothetical protein VE136_04645, partial [Anaerolineales bacterium]|nr:hypothetical protein [Anaerolineales bacterium]